MRQQNENTNHFQLSTGRTGKKRRITVFCFRIGVTLFTHHTHIESKGRRLFCIAIFDTVESQFTYICVQNTYLYIFSILISYVPCSFFMQRIFRECSFISVISFYHISDVICAANEKLKKELNKMINKNVTWYFSPLQHFGYFSLYKLKNCAWKKVKVFHAIFTLIHGDRFVRWFTRQNWLSAHMSLKRTKFSVTNFKFLENFLIIRKEYIVYSENLMKSFNIMAMPKWFNGMILRSLWINFI